MLNAVLRDEQLLLVVCEVVSIGLKESVCHTREYGSVFINMDPLFTLSLAITVAYWSRGGLIKQASNAN